MLRTFASPVELRTPRVLLRAWKESDIGAWIEMNADPEVRQHFPSINTVEQSRSDAARIGGGIIQRGWGMWALEIPGEIPFAGFVGINPPAYPAPWQPAVEIGWRLARAAWHQGYATEAAAASLQFGFDVLELPQIIALSVTTNTPSHNVMTRLGMVRDVSADFVHPRVPEDWPLKMHIVHRISRETWRNHPLASSIGAQGHRRIGA